jgi:transcriptional regulator with XRE-family HTH domain
MKRFSYRERDYAFGQAMLTLRTNIGLTQAGLADHLGVSRRAVTEWEGGLSYPTAHHLQHVITLGVQQQAFPPGREAEEIRAFWKAAHQKVLLDEAWLAALLTQPSPPATPVPLEEAGSAAVGSAPPAAPTSWAQASQPGDSPLWVGPVGSRAPSARVPRVDWSEALDVPSFYGREGELATLVQWVVQERCRVGSALGMGGIGKSALVTSAMRQMAVHFLTPHRSLAQGYSALHDSLRSTGPDYMSNTLPCQLESNRRTGLFVFPVLHVVPDVLATPFRAISLRYLMVCPGVISITSTLSRPSLCNSSFNCAGVPIRMGKVP